MPLRIVQSKQNPRLKELRRALAQPGRGAGLVGIEGPNLLSEAVRAKLRIACVFVAEGSERLLDAVTLPADTETLMLPAKLLSEALTTETPQAIAALVEPPGWVWDHVLESADGRPPLVIVLAALQDPGNLGTIVRSAEAFGATGIVSLSGTVSEWNPKAVRASAGSVFRIPVLSAGVDESLSKLRARGVRILTTAAEASHSAPDINLSGAVALLIGNEGNGVPQAIAAQADEAISIPCPGPVESLNAAVAASILLYEASLQRAGSSNQRPPRKGGPR